MNEQTTTAPGTAPGAELKPATLAMLAGFRARRELIRDEMPAHERDVRRFAADCARERRRKWGHEFTRGHEWPIWNRREYLLMYLIAQRVRN